MIQDEFCLAHFGEMDTDQPRCPWAATFIASLGSDDSPLATCRYNPVADRNIGWNVEHEFGDHTLAWYLEAAA